MKNLLLFATCTAFFFYSCTSNKATITPQTGISATINGTNEKFNDKDSIRTIGTTGIYFSGGDGTTVTSNRIAFYISNPSNVTPGTYTSPTSPIQIFYEKGGPFTNDYFYNEGSAFPVTITVTAVSSTNIQGTFSGKLILESMVNDETPETVTITDGKFNVIANTQ